MSPVIRVDDQVYDWLQSLALPFDDTPNSVLRRVARLDDGSTPARVFAAAGSPSDEPTNEARPESTNREGAQVTQKIGERLTGSMLARKWKVIVRHALYHKDGTWYNNLTRFPGALFDPKGYVVFLTEEEYRRCPQISIGEETNVRPHISAIAGYVHMAK